MKVTDFLSHCWKDCSVRWRHDSIMSHAMSFSRCSRCWRNSASGQWRSRMNDWSASNFQKRSSEVAQPFLDFSMRFVWSWKLVQKGTVLHCLWMWVWGFCGSIHERLEFGANRCSQCAKNCSVSANFKVSGTKWINQKSIWITQDRSRSVVKKGRRYKFINKFHVISFVKRQTAQWMVSYVMIDIQNGKLIGIYGDFQFREGFGVFFIKFYTFMSGIKTHFYTHLRRQSRKKPKWMIFYIGIIT